MGCFVLKKSFALVLVILLLLVITACGKNENSGDFRAVLEITRIDWNEHGAEEKIEVKEVKKGNVILLESMGYTAKITIKNITNSGFNIQFKKDGIVVFKDGIDLLSEKYNWTDEIQYNQDYEIGTQTMDAGTHWKIRLKHLSDDPNSDKTISSPS